MIILGLIDGEILIYDTIYLTSNYEKTLFQSRITG